MFHPELAAPVPETIPSPSSRTCPFGRGSRRVPARTSSSRSTFCASRLKAPSPTCGRLVEHPRLQVVRHQAHAPAPRTSKPSIEWTFSRSSSATVGATPACSWFERSQAAVDERGGGGLAQVVAQRAQHHGRQPRPIEVAVGGCAPRPSPSACAPTRRLPDATRAPAGSRRAAAAPAAAGPRRRGPAPARTRSTAGPPAGAAFRVRPRCARPADRRAGSRGTAPPCRRPARTRSARRTARRAARAGCRRRTSPDPRRAAPAATGPRGRRTDPRTPGQRIPGDRVDGEVAAARRVGDRHGRVAFHHEAAVAAAGLRFAARQRDVDALRRRVPRPCRRGSCCPPARRAPGARSSARSRPAGTPNTSTSTSFEGAPQQPIAHPAADDQRASAGRAHGLRDGRDWPQRIDGESMCRTWRA